jgi:hypothetical protein
MMPDTAQNGMLAAKRGSPSRDGSGQDAVRLQVFVDIRPNSVQCCGHASLDVAHWWLRVCASVHGAGLSSVGRMHFRSNGRRRHVQGRGTRRRRRRSGHEASASRRVSEDVCGHEGSNGRSVRVPMCGRCRRRKNWRTHDVQKIGNRRVTHDARLVIFCANS